MIDTTQTILERVCVHHIGNKTNDEDLVLSKSLLDIRDTKVKELLSTFFLKRFSDPEFYTFTFSNEDFRMNPLFIFASQIFENTKTFHKNSVNVARLLYELSTHPQIKSGDLFVAYFSDVCVAEEVTDVIGIFKSENRQSFLKVESSHEEFSIQCDDGISVDTLDKGCLIFNTEQESGYRVCIVDNSGKSPEAQYWRDSFLQLKACRDFYHLTREFMDVTRNFIAKQLPDELEVGKADKIDLLNRSVEYFKTRENFSRPEFEKEVLRDKGLIESFNNFNTTEQKKSGVKLSDNFEISPQAVKKQARVFKSVLKLDKNFHIYIHGDRKMIEQGMERDGRKFYKIYYSEER